MEKTKELLGKLTKKQIILVVAALTVFITILMSVRSDVVTCIRAKKNINFIIVGTDMVDHSLHSDTLIFVSYNPRNNYIDIISIPRDTKISMPDLKVDRINEVYTYYYRKEKSHFAALEALRNVVETLFLNRVDIPYYFQIDYNAFRKLIDAIGGIKIEIEETMQYDDKAGNLHINFTPGPWMLYGNKAYNMTTKKTYTNQGALEYVRFRTSAGDIGRIYRQQRFVEAIVNKFKNPLTVLRLPIILKCIVESPHTNLSFYDILSMMFELKKIDFANIRKAQLPGKPFRNRWIADEYELVRVLDLIYGTNTGEDMSKVTIEVLNASNVSGIALEVTRKLREQGFDVIDYKNTQTKSVKTIVVDRTGNLKTAQNIANLLNTEEIFTRYDSKRLVDISVYIGEDYKSINE
ncbi:MAG: hypothetical protein A2252_12425 [Elusimicrobia bacterium RIFOXYA2_FULL_39_19]|nr:MAG: hypothetical protein A2252_12425 [Elusimicrobia bacterium RIFOXYA2_FULL_39_19]